MEAISQPEVLLTKESKKIKPKRNWKPVIMIIILLLAGGLIAGGIYYQSQVRKNLLVLGNRLGINKVFTALNQTTKVEPKVITRGKLSDLTSKTQPVQATVFSAELEYDPQSGVVSQLKTGQTQEAMPVYASQKPAISAVNFIYRVEVSTSKDGLIQYGWLAADRKSILTPQKILKLKIITVYQPDALVKVYSQDNNLIWTGKIV